MAREILDRELAAREEAERKAARRAARRRLPRALHSVFRRSRPTPPPRPTPADPSFRWAQRIGRGARSTLVVSVVRS
jgi:hypothetical protein